MIVLDRVSKVYPAKKGLRTVLDNVSLTIEPGVSVGILGRNGAGKSTIVRLLAKAEAPTRGQIAHHMSVSWPLAIISGLVKTATARDNIRFIANLYGVPPPAIIRFVDTHAGLGDYMDVPVVNFSHGMRARLSFALAIGIGFDCYLMDELWAVGDAYFQKRSKAMLKEMRGKKAFVIISHQVELVREYCDIIYVLEKGKLTRYDCVDEGIEVYEAL